jgi:hypothetical protein
MGRKLRAAQGPRKGEEAVDTESDGPMVRAICHDIRWWNHIRLISAADLSAAETEIRSVAQSKCKQWSFQRLLTKARSQLFGAYRGGEGNTNLEFDVQNAVARQFLRTIIGINCFMYSTASTNRPEDPSFQTMFLSGYLPLTHALQLLPHLKVAGLFYRIKHLYSFTSLAVHHEDLGDDSCIASLVVSWKHELPKDYLPHLGNLMFNERDPLVELHIEAPPERDDRTLYQTVFDLLDMHVDTSERSQRLRKHMFDKFNWGSITSFEQFEKAFSRCTANVGALVLDGQKQKAEDAC